MEWFVHIEGKIIVRLISLKEREYTLGRGKENDIMFETPKVSRMHAVLVKEDKAYHILDQNSTNHVFVNNEQVTKKRLTSGDIIQISDAVTLLYLSEPDFTEKLPNLLNHMWAASNEKDFLRLKEVTNRIISLDHLDHILHLVLEEVVKLVRAERGFIALTDEEGTILPRTSIVHNIAVEENGSLEAIFSHSTVQQAIKTREHVFILRSGREETQNFSYSIIALKLQSVMCAPLLFGNKLVGILYVDSGYQHADFNERDRFFFTILSDQAAIAIENAKLYSRVQRSIQQLSLDEARLEALLRLNQMTQATACEIQAFTLEKALELSKSAIGYIGFLNSTETILSIDYCSQRMVSLYGKEPPFKHPLQEAGEWGKVVTQRTPILHNEPVSLEHVMLTRHMSIPVFEGERIVAVIGVGDKKKAYDTADARQLTLLGQAMWRLIQRKHAEEALRESEEKHRILLESIPDPVVVYDLKGTMTYVNPAFTRVFGWTLDTPIQQTADFVPDDKLTEMQLILDNVKHGNTVSGIETCRLTRERTRIDVSISGAGFFDKSNNLQGYMLTFQNISERKKTEKEIKFLAYHDTLTKLPNRKSFYERLDEMLSRKRQRMEGDRRALIEPQKWALLFLDLDRFKYINDTLGHDVGDELLKIVAERLQANLRRDDEIFRLGGDEFTIIVNDLADELEVAKVAHKIQQEISRPCRIQHQELHVTVSIGISLYPNDGEKVEMLVKNADMAMYAAKEDGGGYHFFTKEMNKKAQDRMNMESGLYQAIRDKQFLLHYQPLVNTTGEIVGMEALVRWNHPQKGMISPAKFIPLAEETHVIVLIGEWVLRTACEQIKRWHNMGYDWLYMSVNVSTRQFREPNFVKTVEQVIESVGLDPKFLKLEVTESSIMEKPEEAIAKMNLLCAMGVHFSIDDFGTGYSSLSQMKRFPIDTLKIDRSFVVDSMTNRDDQEIIRAILSMARNLHIETVAEGVETEEQRIFLSREGCQMMQGYYFGRPLPVDDFEAQLKTRYSPHTPH